MYVNPHASMTLMASPMFGNVAHIKQAAPSSAQIDRIGMAQISAVVMVS